MTRLEAQTVIENRLGQRTGLATRIVGELRAAQRHHEHKQFLPWFLRATAVFPLADSYMMMPVGFLREVDDEYAFAIIEDGEKQTGLEKADYQFLVTQEVIGPGKPRFYTMESDANQPRPVANFWPQPEKSYLYRFVYMKADDELVADSTENKWLVYAPDVIINQAGLQIAKALRSVEGTQLFASDLVQATKDMMFSHVSQGMAGFTNLTMAG